MIQEKIYYEEDFPLNITIEEITEYPIHYHKDVEIVYVLSGEVEIKNGTCTYVLKAGDTFINNGHEVHALYATGKPNVTAVLRISNLYFTQFFPDLTHSCYNAYSSRKNDPRLDDLRTQLLVIFLNYLQKGYNYKTRCIELAINLINTLNQDFDLFAFEDKVIVNFKNDDPVIAARISRVTRYLYENHASKITLEDLSEMEHLSTFYMSHLIKENVGMSFRDFLCFARIEWSEIPLLGSTKKISAVAKQLGFSTTAYFEKYFKMWFNQTPQEHRQQLAHMVLSPDRQPCTTSLSTVKALQVVKHCLMELTSQEHNKLHVDHKNIEISLIKNSNPILKITKEAEVIITLEDFRYMKYQLFDYLRKLPCKSVVIQTLATDSDDEIKLLHEKLLKRQFQVEILSIPFINNMKSYALDSIIYAIDILNKEITNNTSMISAYLRDQGDEKKILKGHPSLYTSNLIAKPAYYAYSLLVKAKGDLLSHDSFHSLIKLNGEKSGYFIIAYNYNSSLQQLCYKSSSAIETSTAIASFHDELDLDITLDLSPGNYFLSRYTLDNTESIFSFMDKLHFPKVLNLPYDTYMEFAASPTIDVSTRQVEKSLDVSFSFRGLAVQAVLIQPLIED